MPNLAVLRAVLDGVPVRAETATEDEPSGSIHELRLGANVQVHPHTEINRDFWDRVSLRSFLRRLEPARARR